MKKFVHSGALGDIIYGFPIIKHLGGGVLLTKGRHADFFRSLCDHIDYISSIGLFYDYSLYRQKYDKHLANLWHRDNIFETKTHGEIYNLDKYRSFSKTNFGRYLPQCHADIFGLEIDFAEPWIYDIEPKKIAPIIVHRTERHIDKDKILDWPILKDFSKDVCQIGFEKEHKKFKQEFGFEFDFHQCKDPYEIAQVISGCSIFIGNQSLCFALAEGMKHPRILERYYTNANCGPVGNNGYVSITRELIEDLLSEREGKMYDRIKNKDGRLNWMWIVTRDIYLLRKWPHDYFSYVFDIGAHIGTFALAIGVLQPFAKIIALEPGREQLDYLKPNTNFLNIEIIEKAVGDGNKIFYRDDLKKLGSHFCSKDSGSYEVETIKFSDMFKSSGCKLNDKYLVKIDCEGGEESIFFKDSEAKQILQSASQISMEVHFNSEDTPRTAFGWLDWPEYNNWIQENLSKTHDIQYYKSNKHRGYGHYCIVKKGVAIG